MAINRKTNKKVAVNLPAKLGELCMNGFALQQCRDIFGKDFKAVGEDIKDYLENNTDGFTVDMGVGFPTDMGKVTFTERSNWSVDTDKLEAMVANGDISVAQLIACVSTWKASDLEKTLGTNAFDTVADNNPTEYLTLRANSEYKVQAEVQVRKFQAEMIKANANGAASTTSNDEEAVA